MNTNKVVYGLSIGLIVALIIVAIIFIVLDVKKSHHPPHPHPHPPHPPHPYPNNIGGQTDKHGCYTSAGYKWCKKKNKCVKSWKDNC
jgi:hypothetical protein